MRSIFSLRFVAAVAAVVGLFFALTIVLGPSLSQSKAATVNPSPSAAAVTERRIDFVDQVHMIDSREFEVVAGAANIDAEFVIDGSRSMFVKAGTVGENYCEDLHVTDACAVVADLLGEAVVWFAMVPMGPAGSVELPAIDVLQDGLAHLVNGWAISYARVLDRRCVNDNDPNTADEFDSYRQFREDLGADFISIYSVEAQKITAVQCRTVVPWAQQSITDAELVAG